MPSPCDRWYRRLEKCLVGAGVFVTGFLPFAAFSLLSTTLSQKRGSCSSVGCRNAWRGQPGTGPANGTHRAHFSSQEDCLLLPECSGQLPATLGHRAGPKPYGMSSPRVDKGSYLWGGALEKNRHRCSLPSSITPGSLWGQQDVWIM